MKQKLIAVAVAGIFAAPAVALAQASTVQIYGTLNAEYGFAGGANKSATTTSNRWDGLNSGSSNLGFKGEEKLAGGTSAWFQCETDLGFLKGDQGTLANGSPATQGGWCSRNSALGLKSNDFGSFYIGTWDSPTKRVVAQHRILGETGWHGVQGMLISNGGGFTGTYSARNSNSINYDSPSFAGFTVNAQTTSTKQASTVTTAGLKGRSTSFSLNYGAGPLAASLGYTAQDDNRSGGSAGGVNGRKDTAMVLGASYTIGAAKIGVLYIDGTSQPTATTELKRKSWNIAGTYNLSGPHSIVAGYTVAGDTKTNEAGVVAERGDNTGADQYTIGYQNALSKRTTAGVTYMYAKNDSRATGYSVGNNHMAGMVAGESTSVVALQMTHKF